MSIKKHWKKTFPGKEERKGRKGTEEKERKGKERKSKREKKGKERKQSLSNHSKWGGWGGDFFIQYTSFVWGGGGVNQ